MLFNMSIANKPIQKFCIVCGSPTESKIPEGDNKDRAVCTVCNKDRAVCTVSTIRTQKLFLDVSLSGKKRYLCKRATEPRSGYWTLPAGFLENNETVAEGALRETLEEANAKSDDIKLFFMCDLRHISQIYMMYYGKLLNGQFSPGPESEEVELFKESEIPWDEIAFTVIEKTLRLYYQDKKKGNFSIHFDTIDPR